MYQLTIEHSFDSAHFLAGYQGKCGNIHGHRWRVLLVIQEEKLKEEFGVSSRCMPFEQEHLAEECICCGKEAKQMVYWGKAY